MAHARAQPDAGGRRLSAAGSRNAAGGSRRAIAWPIIGRDTWMRGRTSSMQVFRQSRR